MNALLRGRDIESARAPIPVVASPHERILVVDDDEMVRQISVRTLLEFGYQVDTATDGAAGWEALQAGSYDLLLTDQNMPKLSGLELVNKVRLARMTLPVVLASGALPMEELERYPWLKFAAVLPKPFSSQELLTTVISALSATDSVHDHTGAALAMPPAGGPRSMPPTRWGLNE